MGSDITKTAVTSVVADRLKPIASQLLALKASGGDGKDVNVDVTRKGQGQAQFSMFSMALPRSHQHPFFLRLFPFDTAYLC